MSRQNSKSCKPGKIPASQDIFNDLASETDRSQDLEQRLKSGQSQAQTIQFLKDQGYDWLKIGKFLGLAKD